MTTPTRTAGAPAPLGQTLWTLARNDLRLIGRDSFLIGLIGFAILMAVGLRFLLPWAADLLRANPQMGVEPEALFPLLVGYLVLYQGALLGGIMIGFIILDERDDNTLSALRVTPVPLRTYLLYRALIPTLLALLIIGLDLAIIGLALPPLPLLIPLMLLAALNGAGAALFLASFAGSKVEGFAQLKLLGGTGLLVVVAWVAPEPFGWLVGVFPPFWGVKGYWLALAGDPAAWVALAVGGVLMVALIGGLMRRFQRIVER